MSNDPIALSQVSTRLNQTAEALCRADSQNPATRLEPWEISANPYREPKGDNGSVDKKEAATVNDPFARSFYETAAASYGEAYQEGGGPGGFKEKIMPAFEVSRGQLRAFAQHVERITAKLDSDGDGKLSPSELERLPTEIEKYFKETFRADSSRSARLTPQFFQRVEALIREACAPDVQVIATPENE
jgi:hypothetical protein